MAARKVSNIDDDTGSEHSTFLLIVLAAGLIMFTMTFLGIGGYYLLRAIFL